MLSSLKIMSAFLKRDLYIHWEHRYHYFLDNVIIVPIVYTLIFGYLQPYILFGPGQFRLGTSLFVGSTSVDIFWTAFGFTLPFLFDMEHNRFIDYQLSLLHPALVILERIISGSLLTFILMAPYFIMCKLILGSYFDTSTANWFAVYLMLYVSSLFCTAYNMLTMCLIKGSDQLGDLWMRFHNPLILLGGFWIPLSAMNEYSTVLGTISLFNPMVYITEGLRRAFMGDTEFVAVGHCVVILLAFTAVCYVLMCLVFKRKNDHI